MWSLVSVALLHSQQVDIAWGFHLNTLSPVANLLWIAIQARKENFGVAPGNQIPLLHGTFCDCSLIRFQVWVVLKTSLKSPFSYFQRQTFSNWFKPLFCRSITSSSINWRVGTLCLFAQYLWTAHSTVEFIGMPKSMLPLSPATSIKIPRDDHFAYQKEDVEPLFISTLYICAAKGLSFNNFFHIQDSKYYSKLIKANFFNLAPTYLYYSTI